MERGEGRRANRHQRTARRTHPEPSYWGNDHSLARETDQPATWQTVLLMIVIVAGILVVGLMEGPDLEEHARWMAEVKEQGAVVLW